MKLYRAKNGFIVKDFDGETILIPIGEQALINNTLIKLNDTALLLWKALEDELNVMQLTKVLTDEFDIYAYEVIDDIDMFLKKLTDAKALEVRESDSGNITCMAM